MAQTMEHPWGTLKQLSIPIWFFDLNEQKMYVSSLLRKDLRLEREVLEVEEIKTMLHKDDVHYLYRTKEVEEARSSFHLDYRLRVGKGYRWVKDIVTPFYNHQGVVAGYTGVAAPDGIYQSELVKIKKGIIEIGDAFLSYNGQAFFDFLVKYLADILDVDTVLIGELTGVEKEEVTAISLFHKGEVTSGLTYTLEGTPCEQVVASYDCYFPRDVKTRFPGDQLIREYHVESYLGKALLNSEGEVIGIFAIMDHQTQTSGPLSKAMFQVFADRIANELSRMQAENKLRMLSRYDPLTGLVTRTYFSKLLKEELLSPSNERQYVALLLIDIDNFKMINDSWGHARGDDLLRQFARYLRRTFAQKDCVISRISSDEFVVWLRNVSTIDEVCEVSDHIIHSMRQPFIINQKEFYSTASIGITFSSHGEESGEDILRYADAAMHKAKINGKNRYEIYDARMSEQIREELDLKQSLHHALDNGEFILHYQPQVCGKTFEVIGYEALIRWNHPEFGLLSPYHFIRLAEETGMIIDIGEWVLQEACTQTKQWQMKDQRPGLKIAVNLSAQQFADALLPQKVFKALEDSGINSESLIIEITETMVLQDFDRSIDTLNQLRAEGIKVHLDDFGVGFSSLSYLNRLPVDAIKIDRSFINQINKDTTEVAIVNAIISMAKSLGLQVIAEGVEQQAHITYLKQKGCYEYQGYYFSKPVPAQCVSL
ncbi:EAL domain-containing protein [Halobacillus sp. H74]|uniref:EAL domain-containing protein n=1 Tax=Halobacillus sp. H74 TaxID=3457436 RepID=UPI003FCE3472